MSEFLLISQHGKWSASTRSRALRFEGLFEREFDTVHYCIPNSLPIRRPGRIGQILYFARHGFNFVEQYRRIQSHANSADVIFVQRGLYGIGPGWIARPIEKASGRVILDLDDNLFVETPAMRGKGRLARWLYGPQQVQRVLERADEVIVSTNQLAAELGGVAKKIHIIPTLPEVDKYPRSVQSLRGPIQLVWAGTRGGLAYLDFLADELSLLAREGVAELTVICSEPWSGPAHFLQWKLEGEEARLASFDAGIMPLPDTPYAKSKAGYKLLQYMASGMPVIASPIGINRQLVEQSGAGYLCSSSEEWKNAITEMYRNRSKASLMGQRGLTFVAEYASPSELDSQLLKVIKPS